MEIPSALSHVFKARTDATSNNLYGMGVLLLSWRKSTWRGDQVNTETHNQYWTEQKASLFKWFREKIQRKMQNKNRKCELAMC